MSNKPWLQSYPKTVPHEIEAGRYKNIPDILTEAFKAFGSKPAFSNMGVRLSFAQVDTLSRDMAAYYQSLGLKPGDRLVIQMPNLLQYPVALFGALRAGLTVVNLNPLYTQQEMLHHIKDAGAKAVVILENFADKLEAILPQLGVEHIVLTEVGDMFPAPKRFLVNAVLRYVKKMVPKHKVRGTRFRHALGLGKGQAFTEPPIASTDLAFLQYTGGTTGVAKGAMLTHANIVANMQQVSAWLNGTIAKGEGSIIAALPLYHVFCLTVNCLALFANGTQNVLITNPRDIPAFIKTLAAERPHAMTAVSTLVSALVHHSAFRAEYLNRMVYVVCGAMPLSSAVADAWRKKTPALILEGYGLTEASPLVTCNPLDGSGRLGTVGFPVPSTEVELQDDDGKPVPQGYAGELCVRGPQVMQGYWNQPEETQKVLDARGWLHTGDVAEISPEGFVKIVDRKKDMILVSGFNVYPNEVEDVVMQHPKVQEAAAIGVPDEHSGEAVMVFVVRRDQSLTAEELIQWSHDKLTGYKRPRKVEFCTELPKSNVGKILRRPLRDRMLQQKKVG